MENNISKLLLKSNNLLRNLPCPQSKQQSPTPATPPDRDKETERKTIHTQTQPHPRYEHK